MESTPSISQDKLSLSMSEETLLSASSTSSLPILTPASSTFSFETEPDVEDDNDNDNEAPTDPLDPSAPAPAATAAKKKKKKKSKKKGGAKEVNGDAAAAAAALQAKEEERRQPPVLCISRNKHWRYISSYHGPWLQLPVELLESLLVLNMDVNAHSPPSSPHTPNTPSSARRIPYTSNNSTHSLPITPITRFSPPNTRTPPPIDPGVFRSVTTIRRLIDDASDLAVRAASGLSAAALGGLPSSRHPSSASAWATAQSLGLNPLGGEMSRGGGREATMSVMRTHRLRALAVQRLAQAYKADEIAASVMVMQGASALDDVAQRVLKQEPNNQDAKYVHFFHEKIPSRQLAESTPTKLLDELIQEQPLRLEYYRTRGIVRCFRDEYTLACRDFTHALKQAIQLRKARHAHDSEAEKKPNKATAKPKGGKKGKDKKWHEQANGAQEENAEELEEVNGSSADAPSVQGFGSANAEASDPLEAQCLFLRGAAYLQHAVHLIEAKCLSLEGVRKPTSPDVPELRLCFLESGKYGGTEIGNPEGPLGSKTGEKLLAYRAALAVPEFRDVIFGLLRKSIRDHEKFLAHFATLESGTVFPGDLAERTEAAFLLSESQRPGQQHQQRDQHNPPPLPFPDGPAAFTTYHPLLVESHFSILICHLLLGEFSAILPAFQRTAMLVDGLEGYPVFLPARSMAQAEFIEVLERLSSGWRPGLQPHHLTQRRLAIEQPPAPVEPSVSGSTDSPHSSPTMSSVNSLKTPTTISTAPSSRSETPSTSSPKVPASHSGEISIAENLDSIRILLTPVVARQKRRQQKERADRAAGVEKKKGLINIPLHGPRVEIVLAWLGAVHLPDLEGVPQPGEVVTD